MNWDYLAGFFDGEGHVRWDYSTNRTSVKVTWQITQKDMEVIDEIAFFLIENGYAVRLQPNRAKHCGVLMVNRIAEVESLCKRLLPLVIVKKQQIQNVLDAIETRPTKYNKNGAKIQ